MSTISTSGIPTADYVWNPIKGCPNCEAGKCKSGGFPCWAAAICGRYAKIWAKSELEYVFKKMKKKYEEQSPYNTQVYDILTNTCYAPMLDEYIKGFRTFRVQWLHKEFDKSFPVKASRIAVGWMSDISFWPRQWVLKIINKINTDNEARQDKGQELHVFQFLTKFPEVYAKYEFPKNCWLGITVRNQEELEAARSKYSMTTTNCRANSLFVYCEPIQNQLFLYKHREWINWLIVGGQGLGAKKAINVEMIRRIRDDCKELKIPFFFKGWGKKVPEGQEKGKLDGVVWDQIPMGARCIR